MAIFMTARAYFGEARWTANLKVVMIRHCLPRSTTIKSFTIRGMAVFVEFGIFFNVFCKGRVEERVELDLSEDFLDKW